MLQWAIIEEDVLAYGTLNHDGHVAQCSFVQGTSRT